MPVSIPKKHVEKALLKHIADYSKKSARIREQPKKIITLSRQVGVGGRQTGELLAKKLKCTFWGREILDVVANQSRWDYQARFFEPLDEKTQTAIESIIGEFFGRIDKHAYLYLLPKAIYTIAQNDAVILGRGSYLLLPHSFKVRVSASYEKRLHNVMTFEGLGKKEAALFIRKTDRDRERFIKELTGKIGMEKNDAPFDLEIHMDRLEVEDAASIILHGFSLYYYKLKRLARNRAG